MIFQDLFLKIYPVLGWKIVIVMKTENSSSGVSAISSHTVQSQSDNISLETVPERLFVHSVDQEDTRQS